MHFHGQTSVELIFNLADLPDSGYLGMAPDPKMVVE